jgi:hypothetical protein
MNEGRSMTVAELLAKTSKFLHASKLVLSCRELEDGLTGCSDDARRDRNVLQMI